MNEPFSEELLSAYLDGELPSDERARVEEWLTASADHQKLFDDLQAIRRELQALPKQSLDASFSDRVLAAIRQRNPAALPLSGSSSEPASSPVTPASIEKRPLGMPAWRWFTAGVAATLLAVIVGVNTVPETMAKIGMLPQVPPTKTIETVQPSPTPSPTATVSLPKFAEQPTEELARANAKAERGDFENQFADGQDKLANQAAGRALPQLAEAKVERRAARAPAVEREDVNAAPPAPSSPPVAAGVRDAARADLALDKNQGDAKYKGDAAAGVERKQTAQDKAEAEKKSDASFGYAGGAAPQPVADNAVEGVVQELEVTSEQAAEALAMATLRRGMNLRALRQDNKDREGEQGKRELQNRAETRSLQIAALEITGPEHEVESFLQVLGANPGHERARASATLKENAAKSFEKSLSQAESTDANAEAKPVAPGKPGDSLPATAASRGAAFSAQSGGQAKRTANAAAKGVLADIDQAFGKGGGAAEQRRLTVRLIVMPETAEAAAAKSAGE